MIQISNIEQTIELQIEILKKIIIKILSGFSINYDFDIALFYEWITTIFRLFFHELKLKFICVEVKSNNYKEI